MEKLWKKNKVTINADFESILVQENNGKQNPESLLGTNIKNILLVKTYWL